MNDLGAECHRQPLEVSLRWTNTLLIMVYSWGFLTIRKIHNTSSLIPEGQGEVMVIFIRKQSAARQKICKVQLSLGTQCVDVLFAFCID